MPEITPIACNLTPADRTARLAMARELGARALIGLEVGERRALLHFDGERELIDALVAVESDCCSFFAFATTEQGERTELEIRTPQDGEPLLRGLVAGIVAGWERGLAGAPGPATEPSA